MCLILRKLNKSKFTRINRKEKGMGTPQHFVNNPFNIHHAASNLSLYKCQRLKKGPAFNPEEEEKSSVLCYLTVNCLVKI